MESLLLVLLLLGTCWTIGNACSCALIEGPERFCGYDVVFKGQALSVEYEEPSDPDDPFSWQMADVIYNVTVDKIYVIPADLKDNSTSYKPWTISVRTVASDGLCGTTFEFNVDIVFFAIYDGDKVKTYSCHPNSRWDSLSAGDRKFIAKLDKNCLHSLSD